MQNYIIVSIYPVQPLYELTGAAILNKQINPHSGITIKHLKMGSTALLGTCILYNITQHFVYRITNRMFSISNSGDFLVTLLNVYLTLYPPLLIKVFFYIYYYKLSNDGCKMTGLTYRLRKKWTENFIFIQCLIFYFYVYSCTNICSVKRHEFPCSCIENTQLIVVQKTIFPRDQVRTDKDF